MGVLNQEGDTRDEVMETELKNGGGRRRRGSRTVVTVGESRINDDSGIHLGSVE